MYDSQTGELTRHIPERGAVSFRVSPNISVNERGTTVSRRVGSRGGRHEDG